MQATDALLIYDPPDNYRISENGVEYSITKLPTAGGR